MRLICPNCDAQYEVADDAIPESGRDVQCSDCGHAWFQLADGVDDAREDEEALFGAAPNAATEVVPPTIPATPAPGDMPRPHPDAINAEAPPESAGLTATPRSRLDESMLAVLREESEREAAARRDEAPLSIETQTDMALESVGAGASGGGTAGKAMRDRLARLRGAVAEPAEEKPEKATLRRDLLPDIEEINSTLRASSEGRAGAAAMSGAAPQEVPSNGAFRSGFLLMIVVAVALTMAYVMAPQIARHLPASADAMSEYVSAVDKARLWLDQAIQEATNKLQSLKGTDQN